ncbi:MAG: helix-turn-helix domain-containing protein [Pseudomonadota bacterium]
MSSFGSTLREWRARRRLSQLDLAGAADISARHVSFLEKGRANPSRDMVLLLGSTLDIPLAEVNNGLLSAGFAAAYPQLTPDALAMQCLERAVATMLDNHQPWPAIACDAHWNLQRANNAASHIIDLLGAATGADNCTNVMALMLQCDDPDGPIANWPEVARLLLARLRTERLAAPDNEVINQTIAALTAHPRINEAKHNTLQQADVVIPLQIRTGDITLSLFSMIAQFGSVQELSMSNLRIELFFPQDDTTTDYLQRLPSAS